MDVFDAEQRLLKACRGLNPEVIEALRDFGEDQDCGDESLVTLADRIEDLQEAVAEETEE